MGVWIRKEARDEGVSVATARITGEKKALRLPWKIERERLVASTSGMHS